MPDGKVIEMSSNWQREITECSQAFQTYHSQFEALIQTWSDHFLLFLCPGKKKSTAKAKYKLRHMQIKIQYMIEGSP
jgi:hypothetical protein